MDETFQEEKLIEKKQNFYQGDNSNLKKKFKPYMTTRSRNFLSNISYAAVKDQEVIARNFVFDTYVLMVKNLNPLSLERKLSDQLKHEMVYMLWKEYMPNEFICKSLFATKNISAT